METLNCEKLREMLLHVARKVMDNRDYLTEVDSRIGDGDHGIGMHLGMKEAEAQLLKMKETENVYRIFAETGQAMLMSMGGASGVIFGTMFLGNARQLAPRAELKPSDFADFFAESLARIKKRGGAAVGDKTMVDALEPAVAAMQASASEGFEEMLKNAVAAAQTGLENTKCLVAKFGRAKSLMERSIGYQDSGATSVVIIFEAMYEYIKGDVSL